MSTVGDVIDAVFRNWLEPADQQPVTTTMSDVANTTDTAVTLNVGLLTAEELAMLTQGSLIEVATGEQMRVTAFNDSTGAATVTRQANGTTAASIADGTLVKISPIATRRAVLDAVAYEIPRLYPRLYAVDTVYLILDERVMALGDSQARGVVSAYDSNGDPVNVRFVRRHELADGGPAIEVHPTMLGSDITVAYKRSFPKPTAETDDLTSTSGSWRLEEEWLEVVEIGAAGRILGAAESRRVDTEFLTAAIAAQGAELGQLTQVSTAMLRLQQLLLAQHAEALVDSDEAFVVQGTVHDVFDR